MSKNRIKITQPEIRSRAEAELVVGQIRELTIQKATITARREMILKSIDEDFAPQLEPIDTELEAQTKALRVWAEANEQEFAKKKSIELTHGTLGFRTGTPSLVLLNRSWTWEKVLIFAQSVLPNFIRNKPSLDKEGILAQRDDLAEFLPMIGVKVAQGESFFVEPKIEEVETKQTVNA